MVRVLVMVCAGSRYDADDAGRTANGNGSGYL